MKAAFITSYGQSITVAEQPIPEIKSGHLLIKMRAGSINPIDWKMANGDLKALIKVKFPLRLGNDGSGIVEEVGEGVTSFKPGDEVFLRCHKTDTGTFAERFLIPADLVALKPKSLSFEEAAGLPLVGLTSMQALTEKGGMKSGSKVLIHAGAGGVGTFAIQYAKACGAYVATTASPKRHDFLKALGADQVIDYHTQKIEDVLEEFDIVLDTLGQDVHEASYKVLRSGGVLVSILGIPDTQAVKEYDPSMIVRLAAYLHNRKMQKRAAKHGAIYKHLLMYASGSQLQKIAQLVEEGKINPKIDSTFALDDIEAAFAKSRTGRAQGKIIVTIP